MPLEDYALIRRIACLFLCLLLFAAGAAADLPQIPSRYTFSMGYDRLQTAIQKQQQVKWRAIVTPSPTEGVSEGATGAIRSLLGPLELSGLVQCFSDGGFLRASAACAGREVACIEQTAQDGRVGLNLDGEWMSTAQGSEEAVSSLLMLDDLGQSLLKLDYAPLRAGDIPFVTPLYDQGIRLWQLMTPWAEDNNGLRVSSGATGHGLTYKMDTAAVRSILTQWLDEMRPSAFVYGLEGYGVSLGMDTETFDSFMERMRAFADSVEVNGALKFNMAFGEGDVLRYAKGSGTISVGGKRSGVSYSYSCSLSGTRITRKYSIDFQPNAGDTLALTLTTLTSSNNKKSGAQEFTLSAKGLFDGKPYRIKASSEMVNQYALDETKLLTENIKGTAILFFEYAGETVVDIAVKRDGRTFSAQGQREVRILDDLDVTVKNAGGVLFAGLVSLQFQVTAEPEATPSLDESLYMDELDFVQAETVRDALQSTLARVRQNLLAALPFRAKEGLPEAY